MRLAVVVRSVDAPSHRIYRENVVRALEASEIHVIPVRRQGPIPPDCDVVWDPGLGMRPIPPILRESRVPVVVTFHGARIFLPAYVCEAEWTVARFYHPWMKSRILRDRNMVWRGRDGCDRALAVRRSGGCGSSQHSA